jgi:hypothetical protein
MSDSNETPQSRFESDRLRANRDELVLRRRRLQRFLGGSVAAGVVFVPFLLVMAWMLSWNPHLERTILPILVLYALLPFSVAWVWRRRVREIENDIQDLDVQIDLQQFAVSNEERRAEKILRINDFQLRRYYDMNLSQNRWVFGLGVAGMVGGLLIIVGTLYVVVKVAVDVEAKVIVAALGAVGSILTNVVAAIYLKMNTSASENLAAFHSRLVETHQLLLANLLASRIQDTEKRWSTLARLATGLVRGSENLSENIEGSPRRPAST